MSAAARERCNRRWLAEVVVALLARPAAFRRLRPGKRRESSQGLAPNSDWPVGVLDARRPPHPRPERAFDAASRLDAFGTFWHDAGAGLGKGAIPMRSDLNRLPLFLAVLVGGIAIFVAGFIIAAEMRSAVASPAAAATGGGCYTNWNGNGCAAGYTAVTTGEWTTVWTAVGGSVPGGDIICAAPKTADQTDNYPRATTAGDATHVINHEPCAIFCASVTSSVGGIGELPSIAGIGGSPSYNYAIAAVLAFVAVVAFAAGGWYARRRWLS